MAETFICDAVRTPKVVARSGISVEQLDVIELNDAFAQPGDRHPARSRRRSFRRAGESQRRSHRARPSAGHVRHAYALSAIEELHRSGGQYAWAFMCIGVGQGLAVLVEKV